MSPWSESPYTKTRHSQSFTRLFTHSLTHSALTHSLTHSALTHSLTLHSLTHSLCTYSLTHSLCTHSLTHSLTLHLLTHALNYGTQLRTKIWCQNHIQFCSAILAEVDTRSIYTTGERKNSTASARIKGGWPGQQYGRQIQKTEKPRERTKALQGVLREVLAPKNTIRTTTRRHSASVHI